MKMSNGTTHYYGFKLISAWLGVSMLVVLGTPQNTLAQQSNLADLSEREELIIEHVTEKVLQNLLRDEVLDEAISRGIQRYIQRQRKAQAEAQKSGQNRSASKAKNVRPVSPARDHIYGNPDAIVSLIEYSDFECPFCKRFHLTAKRIVDTYAGKVNWVYRHFPLEFHNPGAQSQAEASECAASLGGNDAFWKYADAIYKRTQSNGNGFPVSALVPLAVEMGLNETDFRDCLESGKTKARVLEDSEEGVQIGITGTPGNILLNNRSGDVILRPGAVPFKSLQQSVDRLLKVAG